MSDLLIVLTPSPAPAALTGFCAAFAVVGHFIAGQQVGDPHVRRLRVPLRVSVGKHMKEGQIIGNLWSTGASSGSHWNFRIFLGETRPIDSFVYLKARVCS